MKLSISLTLLFASPLLAQSPPVSPWAGEIMLQPFDAKPFHAVRIPGWVENTIGCGYTLSAMTGTQRERAVKHGVTISEINFVDPFYPYYDSKLLKRRSPHVPLDRIDKDVAEYKKLGVKILAVYPPSLQGEAYADHRDWRRIPTNTTKIPEIDLQKFPHGGMMCLLGPYGDFFIDVLVEIQTKFPDVAAYSFDGLHYGGSCYCEHCRANFRRDTGKEIPNADMNDLEFRRYQHWADRRMEDVVRRAQERLKKINPDVALVTWTTNAGRFGHFLSIPRNMPSRMNLLLDAPDQEFWLDETNRGNSIVPAFANAYAWATTNHRVAFSEPYLMTHGNPYGNDSFPVSEIQRRMLLAATHGACPSIAVGQLPRLQQGVYDSMDELQRRKPWLTHKKPEPWAALVMSDNTRNFYGRSAGKVEERYMANVFGMFRMATEEHLPVAVINDWNLNSADLAKYAVLLLPNAACLDEQQTKAIREFVAHGGGLVATQDTSLFDEFGTPRKNFSLAEVMGANYASVPTTGPASKEVDVNFEKAIGPDYWEKRKNVFEFRLDADSPLNKGKVKTLIAGDAVTFKGPAVSVKPLPGAKVSGVFKSKTGEGHSFPAVIEYQHGLGKVIYLPGGFDAAYYLYPYPYQRGLLKNAVEHVSPRLAPVTVNAPMCVHATVMRQTKEGQRLIVHLFNDVNTTGGHALPTDDVPLREETLPIHDIEITFRTTDKIGKVTWQPDGKELPTTRMETGVTVTVPKLMVHGMVVAELEK
ncbi:ThuA domain-containing protein [Zavarzinella formosa]|uniref:ThuA domain-containing protein n=1 Tax=Zavarzinella formosa TaxID=360055 RepID=UPI0002D93DE8|nr:ThuA domain-containing protein [Zavarzinella formosa]